MSYALPSSPSNPRQATMEGFFPRVGTVLTAPEDPEEQAQHCTQAALYHQVAGAQPLDVLAVQRLAESDARLTYHGSTELPFNIMMVYVSPIYLAHSRGAMRAMRATTGLCKSIRDTLEWDLHELEVTFFALVGKVVRPGVLPPVRAEWDQIRERWCTDIDRRPAIAWRSWRAWPRSWSSWSWHSTPCSSWPRRKSWTAYKTPGTMHTWKGWRTRWQACCQCTLSTATCGAARRPWRGWWR
jgi:hypothetical protein